MKIEEIDQGSVKTISIFGGIFVAGTMVFLGVLIGAIVYLNSQRSFLRSITIDLL